MTAYADIPARSGHYIQRAESWLDDRGRGAWIALMVLGFIMFWPVGLGVLAFMLAKGKFQSTGRALRRTPWAPRGSTGNAAFDAYRAETLRRLEDEQAAFEGFLKRLREARDKAEFDQFMDERAKSADQADPAPEPETDRKDAA